MNEYQQLRERLFHIRMKLSLLASKEGIPEYDTEIAKNREKLIEVRKEMARYKRAEIEKEKGRTK